MVAAFKSCCGRQARSLSREHCWSWLGESPALAAVSLWCEPSRRCRHHPHPPAQGQGATAAPRALSTRALGRRSWAASASVSVSGTSNNLVWTFQLQSQQIHTHAHTRACQYNLSEAREQAPGALWPGLSLSLTLIPNVPSNIIYFIILGQAL